MSGWGLAKIFKACYNKVIEIDFFIEEISYFTGITIF